MGRMQGQATHLVGRMQEHEDRLIERLRHTQTEILRVFLDFQQRNEARDTTHDQTAAGLVSRMASIERRLLQIEAKLLLEPPAAKPPAPYTALPAASPVPPLTIQPSASCTTRLP